VLYVSHYWQCQATAISNFIACRVVEPEDEVVPLRLARIDAARGIGERIEYEVPMDPAGMGRAPDPKHCCGCLVAEAPPECVEHAHLCTCMINIAIVCCIAALAYISLQCM
jgi:hypothetical protein